MEYNPSIKVEITVLVYLILKGKFKNFIDRR